MTSPCSVDGCGKVVEARGWCQMHYRRWQKTGNPLVLVRSMWPERFWAKVLRSEACWIWNGALDRAGYGRMVGGNGGNGLAHRIAYELVIGPIPCDKPHIDHLCRNRACVRPDHLEPVTQSENNQREGAARTHCKHGHPLAGENVSIRRTRGGRECLACRRAQARSRYADMARARLAGAVALFARAGA